MTSERQEGCWREKQQLRFARGQRTVYLSLVEPAVAGSACGLPTRVRSWSALCAYMRCTPLQLVALRGCVPTRTAHNSVPLLRPSQRHVMNARVPRQTALTHAFGRGMSVAIGTTPNLTLALGATDAADPSLERANCQTESDSPAGVATSSAAITRHRHMSTDRARTQQLTHVSTDTEGPCAAGDTQGHNHARALPAAAHACA